MSDVPSVYRDAIAALRPDLADAPMVLHSSGYDNEAVEAAGTIFRFPRNAEAAQRARREVKFLALAEPRVPLPVPRMVWHETPVMCTEHRMIPGGTIVREQYERLSVPAREEMARKLAGFYAALHTIPLEDARAAGAVPLTAWPRWTSIRDTVRQRLPERAHDYGDRLFSAYENLPEEREVFGHFDGHGWNMAFDHDAGVLNGIYDFADAGIGPLTDEFIYASLISADLSERIISAYEVLTGIGIDRRVVAIRMGVQNVCELAQETADVEGFATMTLRWIDYQQSQPQLAV
jgi:hypothetical protein